MRRSQFLFTGALVPCTVALVAMLVLTSLRLRRIEVTVPEPPPAPAASPPLPPILEQPRHFFGWSKSVKWLPFTNAANPFYTLAIQPPPPPQPPPPAPTTRKVDVTYRGFFETSAGVRRAVVQVADKQVLALRGDKVVDLFTATEIAIRHLTLTYQPTNAPPGASNPVVRLEFAKPQAIEVPAK